MKNFIFLTIVSFLLFILSSNKIFAQWGYGPELLISNKTGSSGYYIDIKIYPIGAVYNSWMEYSPLIRGTALRNGFPYLVGFNTTLHNTNDTNGRVFSRRCWCSKKFAEAL